MEHHIGEKISQERQNQKMTQEEFASCLGVTPQAVSKWERGLGMPDIALVGGICKILKVTADELLGIKSEVGITEDNDLSMQREIKNNLIAEPLLLEIGTELIDTVAEGLKTDLIDKARRDLAAKTGFLMPLIRIRDNELLGAQELRIRVYGKNVYQSEQTQRGVAAYEVMVELLKDVCREHYAEILNKQLVKTMIDTLKELYPGIADGIVPEKISYLTLERILKELIQKKGDIRDLIHILEMTEWEMIQRNQCEISEIAAAIAEQL